MVKQSERHPADAPICDIEPRLHAIRGLADAVMSIACSESAEAFEVSRPLAVLADHIIGEANEVEELARAARRGLDPAA